MDSRDDTRVPPAGSPFYEASFVQSASSPASVLMVRIDAFGDAPFGDPDGVVWSPLGNALPAAGDRCLVAESDDGSWWVLAWWSSGQRSATPGAWITPTLNTGWQSLSVNYPVRYRISGLGEVQLSGIAAATNARAIYDAIFTLPVGFRPPTLPADVVFGCACTTGGGATESAIGGSVSSAGAVYARRAMATSDWIALDAIRFFAA